MQKLTWKMIRCPMGDEANTECAEVKDFSFSGSLAEVQKHIEETNSSVDWYSDFSFAGEDGDHYYNLLPVELGADVDSVWIQCRDCKEETGLVVRRADLADFRAKKKFIQDAFPYLDRDDRELFLTAICGKCYAKIFGMEDDD